MTPPTPFYVKEYDKPKIAGKRLKNVMLLYIRVYVVLTWHYSRKKSEKLDITLDRHSFDLHSLGNLVISYFF